MELRERVSRMEALFCEALQSLAEGKTDAPCFVLLSEYMESGQWLRDYEADENGLLPWDMPRGVLAQDALYDLITDWERKKREEKPVIHLFGASGSGTTTLGRALSRKLQFAHMDTDDYFWLPTNPMFTQKRPAQERIDMIRADIAAAARGVVLSGSLVGWGDQLISCMTLAVRVVTCTNVRIERLREREYARFGDRIRKGGDMYAQHLEFLDWAARYDTGDAAMRSKARHDAWQRTLPCPVVTVNGEDRIEDSVDRVLQVLKSLTSE